ncbi:MAG: pantetheine-phosphate adenylyltransferase [Candidatus Midichloriaceae bacterium]|jgi:pantetheine-phosphate adenylyltransferase
MHSKKIAVYPGTFDPITLGHIDIIKRSSKLFDNLIVAVTSNLSKKTLFPLKERVHMIETEIQGINNVTVEYFDGLLVNFVQKKKSSIIIRGLRAVADFEYEFQMSFINKSLDENIETIFLPATGNVHFISSSFVKEVVRLNGSGENLVSKNVYDKLVNKFQDDKL